MKTTGHTRFSLGIILLGITVGMTASRAFAEGGPLSLGVRAVNDIPVDGEGSWKGGGQVRLMLPLFFGVEGSLDYRRNTFGATTAKDMPLMVSALVYPLPQILWVQPFLLAGGGWYHTTVDGPHGYSDTQDRFGPHAGGGVEFNLNKTWYVDATYRYVWLQDLHTVNNQGAAMDVRDRGHRITAGLNYRI